MSDAVPPRRLTRSRDDRMLAGVCGGLADYTGIDPVVFRVVFAVAAVLGGAGIAAYVIAWLVIPEAGDDASHAESLLRDRDRPQLLRLALYIVAAVAIVSLIDGPFDGHWGGGGFGLLLLIGFGIWLWNRGGDGAGPPASPRAGTSTPPPPRPPSPPARPLVAPEEGTLDVPAAGTTVAEREVRPPRPPRERSKLTGLTLSAVLLAAGVMASLEVADVVDIDAGDALAVCLLVVGAGLLVGGFYGRGPGLIAVGIVLAALAAVANVADVPFRGGTGERDWSPAALTTLERDYHLGVGDARLDLSGLDLDGASRSIEVTVGMGRLHVVLPSDVEVGIDAHVGFGTATVLGAEDHGVDVSRRAVVSGDGGQLELDLRVGMGELEVTR